jgi:nucleoside-diphosphate-sugar epimerase
VNVAGGASIRMDELLALVGDVLGHEVVVDPQPAQPGDVQRTGGSIDRANALLGWKPVTDLRAGLVAQAEWHRARRSAR